MFKLIAIYAKPVDPETFTKHLTSVHLPMVSKFPGLRALHYDLPLNPETDDEGFAVVECDFENEADLRAALSSPEGAAASADVPNYAAAGVQIFTYDLTAFPLMKGGAGDPR